MGVSFFNEFLANLTFSIKTEYSDHLKLVLSATYDDHFCIVPTEMVKNNKVFSISCQIPRLSYQKTLFVEVKEKVESIKHPQKSTIKKNIIATVSSMLDDPQFCDFKFIINEREFNVHKCILAAASDVFVKIFKVNENFWKVNDVREDVFYSLLVFIYREKVPANLNDIAIKLFEASDYFKIDQLKEICSKVIHANLSTENALEIYNWAFIYDLEILKSKAWELVKR